MKWHQKFMFINNARIVHWFVVSNSPSQIVSHLSEWNNTTLLTKMSQSWYLDHADHNMSIAPLWGHYFWYYNILDRFDVQLEKSHNLCSLFTVKGNSVPHIWLHSSRVFISGWSCQYNYLSALVYQLPSHEKSLYSCKIYDIPLLGRKKIRCMLTLGPSATSCWTTITCKIHSPAEFIYPSLMCAPSVKKYKSVRITTLVI